MTPCGYKRSWSESCDSSAGKTANHRRRRGEVYSLLTDPFATDHGGEALGDSAPVEAIGRACQRMQTAATKRELLRIIAAEVGSYHLHDLELMNAHFERKVENLPEDYRERLLESVREEIFGAHHRLVLLSRNGADPGMDRPSIRRTLLTGPWWRRPAQRRPGRRARSTST